MHQLEYETSCVHFLGLQLLPIRCWLLKVWLGQPRRLQVETKCSLLLRHSLCAVTQPLCVISFGTAVDCGPLPVLLNGSHVGDMTTYPNKVTSYCDEGFFLRGSKERFCQADRTWSGTQTICEGDLYLILP